MSARLSKAAQALLLEAARNRDFRVGVSARVADKQFLAANRLIQADLAMGAGQTGVVVFIQLTKLGLQRARALSATQAREITATVAVWPFHFSSRGYHLPGVRLRP